jgi:CRP-like cAMP-binding protein
MRRTRKQIAETLGSVWLFQNCSRSELAKVTKLGTVVEAPADAEIMRRGDRGTEFYVVLSGRIRIERPGFEPKLLGPGTPFGEMALVDGSARSATVSAASDCELYAIRRGDFALLLREAPSVALKLIETLGLRLRSVQRENLKLKTTAGGPTRLSPTTISPAP